MIKGYFFNAGLTDGVYDRIYTAEDFTKYLDEIVGDGVFLSTPTALQVAAVYPNGGMTVLVGAGQMWIQGRKLYSDSELTLTVPDADTVKDVYYGVVAYLDYTNRLMNIELVSYGDTAPTVDSLVRDTTRYEMLLGYLIVPKQATTIQASYITDTRADTSLCGYSSLTANTSKLTSGTNTLQLDNANLTIQNTDGETVTPISETVNDANTVNEISTSNAYATLDVQYVKVGRMVTFIMQMTPTQAISSSTGAFQLPDLPHIEQPFTCLGSISGGAQQTYSKYAKFGGYQDGTTWKTQVNFMGSYTSGTTYIYTGSYICQN